MMDNDKLEHDFFEGLSKEQLVDMSFKIYNIVQTEHPDKYVSVARMKNILKHCFSKIDNLLLADIE